MSVVEREISINQAPIMIREGIIFPDIICAPTNVPVKKPQKRDRELAPSPIPTRRPEPEVIPSDPHTPVKPGVIEEPVLPIRQPVPVVR